MNELLGASAALASLMALTRWAQAVPTRAWGDGAASSLPARQRAWAVAVSTLLLQTAAAIVAAGWAAGIALVLAAWMGLGWLLVLAMNQWPHASLHWAQRVGWAGGGVCVVALVVHGLRLGAAH